MSLMMPDEEEGRFETLIDQSPSLSNPARSEYLRVLTPMGRALIQRYGALSVGSTSAVTTIFHVSSFAVALV